MPLNAGRTVQSTVITYASPDDSVALFCKLCAIPYPDVRRITWIYQDGERPLPDGAIVANDSVRIGNVEEDHYGKYTCLVPYGNDTKPTQIEMQLIKSKFHYILSQCKTVRKHIDIKFKKKDILNSYCLCFTMYL